jgi:hypothetical protein
MTEVEEASVVVVTEGKEEESVEEKEEVEEFLEEKWCREGFVVALSLLRQCQRNVLQ